jgi:hypothetical protein
MAIPQPPGSRRTRKPAHTTFGKSHGHHGDYPDHSVCAEGATYRRWLHMNHQG